MLVIPKILINIMSCNGFSKFTTSTVIIICHSALVPYFLSKVFLIVEKVEGFFLIYQNEFSGKPMILYYMMNTEF